jgi:L-ascorbate metabolism protein UlaG (beta-lactamase superfamily)
MVPVIREIMLDLPTLLEPGFDTDRPVLAWLGQAGFVIRYQQLLLVIDPYLSDSLAKKYRGTRFPHTRMMPPPVPPESLSAVDVVFCTHAHTDHMDPETLSALAEHSPLARFVVPRAENETAVVRGVPADRMLAVNAGDDVQVAADLRVRVVASAHETLQTDPLGNHRFLGYVLELGRTVLYHSGDCVPYPGLVGELASSAVQVAILPVNGRDDYRRSHGVPGNFTFAEAAALCAESHIPTMIPCHFGMFEFNTLDEASLDSQIAAVPRALQCIRPSLGRGYELG